MVDDLVQDFEQDAVFTSAENDYHETLALQTELTQLMNSALALENYGLNPSSLRVLQTTGLLNGTALQTMGLESFSYSGPKDPESVMAIEALGDKIKETAAKWSAKILQATKSVSETILSVLSPLMTKVSDLIKALTAKAWDKTKAAGRTIKAHPVKTILVVVGAIVAVASIMAYCGSSLPGGNATKEMFESFFKTVEDKIGKIPSPFGKKFVEVTKTRTHRYGKFYKGSLEAVWYGETAEKYKTIEELGWTEATVVQLGGQLDKAWDALKIGAKALGIRALKVTSTVGHSVFDKAYAVKNGAPQFVYNMTGSKEAAHATAFASGAIFYGGCISLVFAIYRLIKKVVVGGLRLIISTLRSLTGI